MKKYKIIVLIMFLFLITGCDGGYKIEFYKNKVTESAYAWYEKETLNNLSPYDKTLEITSKYDDNGDFLTHDYKENIKKSGYSGIKITKKYNSLEDYKTNSKILGSCYLATNLTNHTDYITLKTTKEFTCYDEIEEFENIEIIVQTNHEVVEHNADKRKGHSYYWYINKENYKNKPISIKMEKNEYVWNYKNEAFKRLGLALLVVGLTTGIIYIVYTNYYKKENDFSNI